MAREAKTKPGPIDSKTDNNKGLEGGTWIGLRYCGLKKVAGKMLEKDLVGFGWGRGRSSHSCTFYFLCPLSLPYLDFLSLV